MVINIEVIVIVIVVIERYIALVEFFFYEF